MPHIHEKIDYTVEVFIVHKDKLLLRMHDKHKIWLSIGGHIELDENPNEAAVREVKEEVGLDVKIAGVANGPMPGMPENMLYEYLIPPKHLGLHPSSPIHTHIVFVYYATADSDVVKTATSAHEQAETKWVSMEELKTMELVPNVRFYAEEALKELGQ